MNNGEYPTLADAQALLPDAVLLPIDLGTKKPLRSKWQHTTYPDTQKPGYQRLLANAQTIGALLGPPSNGLADLDCDTEPYLVWMLEHNPVLQKTLRTRGARAGGIWFRCTDHTLNRLYPLHVSTDSALAKGGKPDEKTRLVKIGELRCGCGQSILCGLHPSRCNYRWPEVYPPAEIDPKTLIWPEEVQSQLPWHRQKHRAKIGSSYPGSKGGRQMAIDEESKALLEEAKARLPVYPVLWQHFGFPDPIGNPTNSPLRDDRHPSFSIYDEGARWKDHASGDGGDSFDFYQRVVGRIAKEAFREFVILAGLGYRLRGRANPPPTEPEPAAAAAPNPGKFQSLIERLQIYYDQDRSCWWMPDTRDQWIKLTASDVGRHLAEKGFNPHLLKGQTCSQIDRILNLIQMQMTVESASALAGFKKGILNFGGKRILITSSPELITPREGDWPTLLRFLLKLLSAEQFVYFRGWMKVAIEALLNDIRRPGQALVLTGEKDCGKSLLQKLITVLLGGRMAEPYLYMSGSSSFNGNLFGAEHLMIEDRHPHTDIKSRRSFGTKIKEFTASDDLNCHFQVPKWSDITGFLASNHLGKQRDGKPHDSSTA
jgi:hypothetical protein